MSCGYSLTSKLHAQSLQLNRACLVYVANNVEFRLIVKMGSLKLLLDELVKCVCSNSFDQVQGRFLKVLSLGRTFDGRFW